MIADSTIEQIKAVPIYDIVSTYISLKRKGAEYVSNCPFHDERTPSFYVHPAKNIYKCFGCGVGGDAIDFVMNYEHKEYIEALQTIAGISGIYVDDQHPVKKFDQISNIISKAFKQKQNITDYDTIPAELMVSTPLAAHPLIASFIQLFGVDVVSAVCNEYHITTDGRWIRYPQFDYNGRLRTGKKMLCDANAKRNKDTDPVWLHHEYRKHLPQPFNFQQCLYGEELLLKYPTKKVAIVEGQSTMLFMACIAKAAEMYNVARFAQYAQYVWLSTGGATSMPVNSQTMIALKCRVVKLYPDAGFYEAWQEMAVAMYSVGVYAEVDQVIEDQYRKENVSYNEDLRDYFMRYADEIKQLCKPITAPQTNLLNIHSNDILIAPIVTYLGKEYNNTSLLYAETTKGNFDLLFDSEGGLLQPGDEQLVTRIENFFDKKFLPAKLDGIDCLIHHLITNNQ